MDREELLNLFTQQERLGPAFPDVRVESSGDVIRHVALDGTNGFIPYSRLNENTVEAAIREEVDYFQRRGIDFEWKVYDYDQPPDLVDRLRAHGFEIEEREALMVMHIPENPGLLSHPIPGMIRRVEKENEIDQLMAMEEEVWGSDHKELGRYLKTTLRERPETLSIYAAWVGEKPVSAAWLVGRQGSLFGSLWGGSTLPEHRRQGWYTGLLAVRVQEAWRRGLQFLYVDASPMSRPILEKHGFQFLGYSNPCQWKAR